MLLPGTQLPDAAGIAERLRLMVEDLSIPATAGATIRPTVSIGVAASGTGSPSLDKLLAHADQAMYQAKRRGRNRVSTEAEPA
ncbi:MAG: GGDEF domain-containing protein [Burkholderiales bacterium]|nr:GGDEF domain-containing protein [Burkholderiales bacterium]